MRESRLAELERLRGLLLLLAVLGCSSTDVTRVVRSIPGSGGADGSVDGSDGSREVCVPGDTRLCVGPGACRGAQACLQDRRGWSACDCGNPMNTGGTSGTTHLDGGDSGGDAATRSVCPSAMYLLLDQSASMSCSTASGTRWDALKSALTTLSHNKAFAGLYVGLGYFGTAASPPGSLCTPSAYRPDVEFGPLGTNASAIAASLEAHAPLTDTPTLPAIQSAISQIIAWKALNLGHDAAVVLVTDGRPNACGANTFAQITDAADAGFASGAVRTYVIGLIGSGSTCAYDSDQPIITDLDAVAAAGRTTESLVVDTLVGRGTVASRLGDAFARVASEVSSSCSGFGGVTGAGGVPSTGGTGGHANSGGVGGAPGTGGTASTDAGSCPVGEKKCGGICIAALPSNGCSTPGCMPCPLPPANGALTCHPITYACDFACLSGFTKLGSSCVASSDAGGSDGSSDGSFPDGSHDGG